MEWAIVLYWIAAGICLTGYAFHKEKQLCHD